MNFNGGLMGLRRKKSVYLKDYDMSGQEKKHHQDPKND